MSHLPTHDAFSDTPHRRWSFLAAIAIVSALSISGVVYGDGKSDGGIAGTPIPLATTSEDFFQPGTQPLGSGVPGNFDSILSTNQCVLCHSNYGNQDPFLMVEPMQTWAASMMGQSARDPLFYAGLTIANQDAPGVGEYCIRCHAPVAFLSGHASPPDGSAFDATDLQGVQCNFCHRMVNAEYQPGVSPPQDQSILNDLTAAGLLPPQGSNSRYVIDPTDVRRGPFDDVPSNIHPGAPQPQIIHSPFHTKAEFCWNCHDVSNPLMVKQGATYVLDSPLGTAHPTHSQGDMFPLHRTYSEWKNSYYSGEGVPHEGRFGGNHATGIMRECQDCHMPDQQGYGCNFEFDPFFERPNVPQHSFIGSNTWVINAIRTVDADGDSRPDHPDSETGLSDDAVNAALARNIDFLEKASDVFLTKIGNNLKVRLFNITGHKLPTGFPDGRRIWINVKFFDCLDQIILERGAYDFETAALTTQNTKVYEVILGIQGTAYAQSIGHPEGPTFHFMLANQILKDNRIPPAGHSSVLANQNQTASVGATYFNLQNWDDTLFAIPSGTTNIVVTVYYQITSREFIEHLRDDNTTDNQGQVVYDLWVEHGMGMPVVIDMAEMAFYRPEDVDQNGTVDVDDLLAVIAAWGECLDPCPPDVTGNEIVDVDDLLTVINGWGPC